MDKPLNIFEFSKYRIYLKSWLEAAKRARVSNLSRLAEAAGVHPTFLSHVLGGAKDLSQEQAAFISAYLKHTPLEQDYFFILVNLERAGTAVLREYWLTKKKQLESEKNKLSERLGKHHTLTDEQRATFYSSWLYVAIWVSTAIEDGQTLAQIAERFRISRALAEEILAFLVRHGICVETKGRYSMGETHVHVPNTSPFVVKHHMNWRMQAVRKMDTREEAELFFSAPMSISRADFDRIREKLNAAIKDIVDTAKASPAEEVACVNIDFFRTTGS